jgi:oxygen-dependent protoporphyrinogen oxidase
VSEIPQSGVRAVRRVAVIGGGISGLAAANRLMEARPDVDLLLAESRPRLGGVLWTVHEDGFQVEQSADNFITTVPWGLDLCKRLGLADELVQTNPNCRRTYVIRSGRLCRLPDGFLMMAPTQMWPLAVTPILSPLGKLRAAIEYVLPPRKDDSDESMAAFVRRRLGREVFERLVEPLVSAVYAADMEKLSLLATLPRFREMERKHGSLIRAMRSQMKARRKTDAQAASQSGARYSMFVTLRTGLTRLVEALAARLPQGSLRLNTEVQRLERRGEGWRLYLFNGDRSAVATEDVDAVILATPSHVAGRLLAPQNADLGQQLVGIAHSGTAILSVAYRREQVGHALDGMGAVVPAVERSPILAISFSSRKYTHRAPEGTELLRVFAGGERQPELATLEDAKLIPQILEELGRLLHIRGEPIYLTTAHWPGTMPQYYVGHLDRVAAIESHVAAIPGLELAGNAYRGVGVPNCIHSGELAAEKVLGIASKPETVATSGGW